MKKIFDYILLEFIIFIYIMMPSFKYFPISEIVILLFFLSLIIMLKKDILNVIYIYRYNLSIFLLLSSWSMLLSGIYNFTPIFAILMLKVIFYILFSSLFLRYIFIYKKKKISFLLILILGVIIINSSIILAEFLFPTLNLYIESFLNKTGNIDFLTEGVRLRGLSHGGGAALAALNAFGILLVFYLTKIKVLRSLLGMLLISILLLSLLFIGRTGFLLSILILFYYIIFGKSKTLIIKLFIFDSLLIIMLVAFFIANYPERYDYFLRYVSGWALEFFSSASNMELTKSNADLLTMYHIPTKNIINMLFGYGFFDGISNLIKRSDVGYIKTITSIGIFGAIIFYSSILYLMCKTFNIINRQFFYLLLLPLYLLVFVSEFKEPFIYQQYLSRVLFLFLALSSVNIKPKTSKEQDV